MHQLSILPQYEHIFGVNYLQVMEELWDSLCHEENEIDSPEWHKEILESRRRKIEKGDAEFISLEDLKAGNYK